MKTCPGLWREPLRFVAALVVGVFLSGLVGCASRNNRVHQPTYAHPPPPVVSATEVLRQDAVRERTRELIKSGKYKTTSEARRAAESENPATVTMEDANEATRYRQWQKQRAAQTKFEEDLDKLKRN